MSQRNSFQKCCKKNHANVKGTKKSADVLNLQLRIACADGQMYAVRHLLEEGGEPFHIVSSSTYCAKKDYLVTDLLFPD